MAAAAPAFPRGKGDGKAKGQGYATQYPDAQLSKKPKLQQDTLFGASPNKRRLEHVSVLPSKRAKDKASANALNLLPGSLPQVGLGMTKALTKRTVHIETLTSKKYVEGVSVFGYILHVARHHLTVSLPNGMSGSVPAIHASDLYFVKSQKAMDPLDEGESSAMPPLTDIFHVNQPVRCVVLGHDERFGLQLSLRASLLNKGLSTKHLTPGMHVGGCVVSVEDHGFVISLGIEGLTAFMPTRKSGLVPEFIPGQPIECVVETVNQSSRTVVLKGRPKLVSKALVSGRRLPFRVLSAGMLVNAVVDKIVQNGMVVSFLTGFYGVIDNDHFGKLYLTDEWKGLYSKGDVVRARIIFIDQVSKSVRLSLQPHVVGFEEPKALPKLGEWLTNYAVVRIDRSRGIFLRQADCQDDGGERLVEDEDVEGVEDADAGEVDDGDDEGADHVQAGDEDGSDNVQDDEEEREEDDQEGHQEDEADVLEGDHEEYDNESDASSEGCGVAIHISQVADTRTDPDQLPQMFKIGQRVECRVVGYALVEGFALATCKPSVLESTVVHKSQVELGQVLDATVKSVSAEGLLLTVGGKLECVCTPEHMADTVVKNPVKRFKVGSIVRVLVWEVQDKVLYVSAKPTIVSDEATALTLASLLNEEEPSENELNGRSLVGVVNRISDRGLQVQMMGRVRGVVPMILLVKQGVTDPMDAFRISQPIRCVVLHCKCTRSLRGSLTLRLTLALDMPGWEEAVEQIKKSDKQSLGLEIPSRGREDTVTNALVSGSVTGMMDQNLVIRLDDGRAALLPRVQTAEIASFALEISKQYKSGSRVEGMIVLQNRFKGHVLVSLKPLLVQSITSSSSSPSSEIAVVPSKLSQVISGQHLAGYVAKVEDYGVIVRFRERLTALAPRSNIADKFVSTPVGMFSVGDSVRCVVTKVDATTERVTITFKPSYVNPSNAEYLRCWLRERCLAGQLRGLGPDWRNFPIGTTLDATVFKIRDGVIHLHAPDNKTVLVASGKHLGADNPIYSLGDTVKVRVLDVDFDAQVLDVTCVTSLVKEGRVKRRKGVGVVAVGAVVAATVQLNKNKYVVVRLEESSALGFIQVCDFHTPYLTTEEQPGLELEEGKVATFVVHRSNAPGQEMKLAQQPGSDPYAAHVLLTLHARRAKRKGSIIDGADDGQRKRIKQGLVYENLKLGRELEFRVKHLSSTVLRLGPLAQEESMDFEACVHVTAAIDRLTPDINEHITATPTHDDDEDQTGLGLHACHPFSGHKVGDAVRVRVLYKQDGGEHKRVYFGMKSAEVEGTGVRPFSLHVAEWGGKHGVDVRQVHRGVVTKMLATGCGIALSPFVSGILRWTDAANTIEEVNVFQQQLFVGMAVTVMVMEAKGFKLRLSRLQLDSLQLSAYGTRLPFKLGPELMNLGLKSVKAGDKVLGMIDRRLKAHRAPALMLRLSAQIPIGRVCITELAERSDWIDMPLGKEDDGDVEEEPDDDDKDDENTNINANEQVVEDKYGGIVDVDARSLALYPHGKIVTCVVLQVLQDGACAEVSLRSSRVGASSRKRALKEDVLPDIGQTVQAYVCSTTPKGSFMRVSRSCDARVLLKDLADGYVKDPAKLFPPGRLVVGVILDASEGRYQLSLRRSLVVQEQLMKEVTKLKKGMTVTGRVVNVISKGVFVSIDNTPLTGLSRPEIAVDRNQDVASVFEVGDIVRAKVLKAGGPKNIVLALKPSLFGKEQTEWADSDDDLPAPEPTTEELDQPFAENEHEGEEEVLYSYQEEEDEEDDMEHEETVQEPDMEDEAEVHDEQDVEDDNIQEVPTSVSQTDETLDESLDDDELEEEVDVFSDVLRKPIAGVEGPLGLQWEAVGPTEDAGDSEDNEDDPANLEGRKNSHKTRHKEAMRKKEEHEVERMERRLMDNAALPETAEDFERLLVSQPNSSLTWIQYMALKLKLADIEGARQTAERALKTIHFREEEEKRNMWMALLNLEHKYGTQGGLQAAFQRALQFNNPKGVYLHMADMYEQAKDLTACEDMFKAMLTRFKYSKKVWMAYQHFCLRHGKDEEARSLLHRSLQSLAQHKHVLVTSSFAQAEFDHGSVERGRTVFENLLGSYPKRTDLWHIYVDREIKHDHIDHARRLFRRMVSVKMSPRAMKAAFKKFLQFEMTHGSPSTIEEVKELARQYVERIA